MKMKGPLVDMPVAMNPDTYAQFVVQESSSKALSVEVLKAIYGMLQSS
jgi:hypothetical protein